MSQNLLTKGIQRFQLLFLFFFFPCMDDHRSSCNSRIDLAKFLVENLGTFQDSVIYQNRKSRFKVHLVQDYRCVGWQHQRLQGQRHWEMRWTKQVQKTHQEQQAEGAGHLLGKGCLSLYGAQLHLLHIAALKCLSPLHMKSARFLQNFFSHTIITAC